MALTAFRELLARTGLSVVELIRRSEALFGRTPHAHIPHNWYHLIEVHGLSPHIDHLVALSVIAGVPLLECLRAVGIDLRRLWSLQAGIQFDRTSLIPEAAHAAYLALASVPRFDLGTELLNTTRLSDLVGQRLELTPIMPNGTPSRYRYARIGQADIGGVPALLPGSLVRVDTMDCETAAVGDVAATSTPLYLIDDGSRLMCRHVVRVDGRRALLVSPNPEFEPVECRVPGETRIVGAIDLELRRIEVSWRNPKNPARDNGYVVPQVLRDDNGGDSLGTALRIARERLGLHLRDASRLTHTVASECGSERYAISLGSLSDYEAHDVLPRHIEKIFTLACVYAMDFFDLLTLGGVQYSRHALADTVRESIAALGTSPNTSSDGGGGLHTIPEYLVPYVALDGITPRDVYLVGRSMVVRHPALQGAIALVARRHNGSVAGPARRAHGGRPLYLLQRRDGGYLCGWCVRDDKSITIVAHPQVPARPHRVVAKDVDVIGRVTAVLRRL